MNVTLLTRLHVAPRYRDIGFVILPARVLCKGKQKYLARFHFPPRMKFPRETFRHVLIKQEELFNRTLANFRSFLPSFLRISFEGTCPRKECVFIFFRNRVNLKKKNSMRRTNHPLPPRIHPLSRKRCSTGEKKKIAKAGQVTRMEESNVKTVSPKHRKVSLCAFRFVYRETKHEPETGKCFLSVYIG